MIQEDIKKLIPQREPIIMVDQLVSVKEDRIVTRFTVPDQNLFLYERREMAETGLIEHIAQSASAWAGYKALSSGASEAPIGYIGEIKNFRCYRRPVVGEQLQTTITFGAEMNGITILTGESRVSDELIAETRMKIFVK
ncbi:MAG: beta-hydroxyacyl-ACP dehydratase [Parabacteroides sp.]|nr:beta-hydroxyacyl-ACP dehydratase [Parabacteroides sp.]